MYKTGCCVPLQSKVKPGNSDDNACLPACLCILTDPNSKLQYMFRPKNSFSRHMQATPESIKERAAMHELHADADDRDKLGGCETRDALHNVGVGSKLPQHVQLSPQLLPAHLHARVINSSLHRYPRIMAHFFQWFWPACCIASLQHARQATKEQVCHQRLLCRLPSGFQSLISIHCRRRPCCSCQQQHDALHVGSAPQHISMQCRAWAGLSCRRSGLQPPLHSSPGPGGASPPNPPVSRPGALMRL